MTTEYWLSSKETSALFENLTKDIFQFLIQEYKFNVHKVDKDGYGCRVYFSNETTGMQVNYEPGSLRIWLIFYKLKNKEFPEYLLTPIPGLKSKYFYLEDIMAAQNPNMLGSELYMTAGKIDIGTPITDNYLHHKLTVLADCIKKYALDICGGDFSIFDKAQTILDERVRRASERKS